MTKTQEYKDKIARYFGYTPEPEARQAVLDLVTELQNVRSELKLERTANGELIKHQVYLNSVIELAHKDADQFRKPAPALKEDVKQIIGAIKAQGFHQIGVIQDQYVYVYMFATQTEMYWLQVNYDGEYCYLMKQINNQNIAELCKLITAPNLNKFEALKCLDAASDLLNKESQAIEIKSESANTQVFNKLTTKEKHVLSVIKKAVKLVQSAVVSVREL